MVCVFECVCVCVCVCAFTEVKPAVRLERDVEPNACNYFCRARGKHRFSLILVTGWKLIGGEEGSGKGTGVIIFFFFSSSWREGCHNLLFFFLQRAGEGLHFFFSHPGFIFHFYAPRSLHLSAHFSISRLLYTTVNYCSIKSVRSKVLCNILKFVVLCLFFSFFFVIFSCHIILRYWGESFKAVPTPSESFCYSPLINHTFCFSSKTIKPERNRTSHTSTQTAPCYTFVILGKRKERQIGIRQTSCLGFLVLVFCFFLCTSSTPRMSFAKSVSSDSWLLNKGQWKWWRCCCAPLTTSVIRGGMSTRHLNLNTSAREAQNLATQLQENCSN